MPHFTYKDSIQQDFLCQGDILTVTDDIKKIFQDCHPYFDNPKYHYFIVLTQTCDLVRRNGVKCKSKYITIAAVRDLEDYLIRETENRVTSVGKLHLLEDKDETYVRQLLERVLNNNEMEHFYLSEDPTHDFNNPMVAYLKVSIALKSELHYNACLDAKVLELSDEFKAKLGWLVGQMYSRVGTPDWHTERREDEFNDKINKVINETFVVGKRQQLKQLESNIKNGKIDPSDLSSVKGIINSIVFETNQQKFENLLCNICKSNKKLFKSDDDMMALLRYIQSSRQLMLLIKKD